MGKDAAPDFAGTIGRTIAESRPFWPGVRPPPKGAPNILLVLFEEVGFSGFTGKLIRVVVEMQSPQVLDGEHVGRAEMARQ